MNFRVAKINDSFALAKMHKICGEYQKDGFMHKLGVLFLYNYYRVSLKEKHSVILIADDSNGMPIGFISGTLDAKEHQVQLKRNTISLGISAFIAILRNPFLLQELYKRKKSLGSKASKFIVDSGARGEYWAWLPKSKNTMGSGILRQAWINVLGELGCKSFRYELDLGNSSFEKYEKIFGCTLIEEIILPDGRKRIIVEQNIKKRKI
jgi:hypothetical protein